MFSCGSDSGFAVLGGSSMLRAPGRRGRRYHGRTGEAASELSWAPSMNQSTSEVYSRPTNGAVRSTALLLRAHESPKPKICLSSRKATSFDQRRA